jgi:hypothetical protein
MNNQAKKGPSSVASRASTKKPITFGALAKQQNDATANV